MHEHDRYPGYDVTRKRDTLSFNDATRRVIDTRLGIADQRVFFSETAWETLNAVCDRIIPQPTSRPRVPIAAYLDQNLRSGVTQGFRNTALPPPVEAWPRGLAAIGRESEARHNTRFALLEASQQDKLLKAVEDGSVSSDLWTEIDPKLFFSTHVMTDIIAAYYAHPTAWSEIGYGGPASPRGYVRMHADERDPWEAIPAKHGAYDDVRKRNLNVR